MIFLTAATLELSEIFGQSASFTFGNTILAAFALLIGVAILFWLARAPFGAILLLGLPLMGALALMLGGDQAIMAIYLLGAAVIGVLIFLAIGQITQKW